MRRIGPKMTRVTEYVAANPGCAKIGPAWAASPYPGNSLRSCGLGYGYRSVDRALGAGLITSLSPDGPYRLFVTGQGARLLGLPVCAGCGEPAEQTCEACDVPLCQEHARSTADLGVFCADQAACSGRLTGVKH